MTLSEPSYDGAGGDVGHVARYVFITMFTECHAMFYSYLRIKKKKIHQLSKMTYQKSAREREREKAQRLIHYPRKYGDWTAIEFLSTYSEVIQRNQCSVFDVLFESIKVIELCSSIRVLSTCVGKVVSF